MTLAQSLTAVIIFWAVIGGLGASLLLPAMQSLIHGNFEGAAQKKAYAMVGAAAAIARRSGRCSAASSRPTCPGGSAFLLEAVVIAVVLSGIKLVRDVPYTGPARGRLGRRRPLGAGHGRRRARHPGLAGGRRVASARSCRRRGRAGRPRLLAACAASAQGKADAARPGPVPAPSSSGSGVTAADAPADRARRRDDRAADLPADGARVQRDGGRPVARAAVAEHVRGRAARRQAGRQPPPGQHHPARLRAALARAGRAHADRAAGRLRLVRWWSR